MIKRAYSVLLSALLLVITLPAYAADSYEIDASHTHVGFIIDHLGFSKVHGRFDKVSGMIMLDEKKPENSSVKITVAADSINTNHGKRDDHLRSPDFLNSLEFNHLVFESTGVFPAGNNRAMIKGKLTLLGVTREIELSASLNKLANHPFKKDLVVAGFSATGTIKRSDFGMKYGLPLVGDDVTLVLEAEGIKK